MWASGAWISGAWSAAAWGELAPLTDPGHPSPSGGMASRFDPRRRHDDDELLLMGAL